MVSQIKEKIVKIYLWEDQANSIIFKLYWNKYWYNWHFKRSLPSFRPSPSSSNDGSVDLFIGLFLFLVFSFILMIFGFEDLLLSFFEVIPHLTDDSTNLSYITLRVIFANLLIYFWAIEEECRQSFLRWLRSITPDSRNRLWNLSWLCCSHLFEMILSFLQRIYNQL